MSQHPASSSPSRGSYPMSVAYQFLPGGCVVSNSSSSHKYSLLMVHAGALKQAHAADVALNQAVQAATAGMNTTNSPIFLPSLSLLAEAAFSRLTGCHANHARDWADAMILQYSTQHHASLTALLQSDSSTHTSKQKGPCGYVFQRGDIAWNCRSCQTDPTCVICDSCFRNSHHAGHEVYFHRTTPGGCCDCGDAEAWNYKGCCPDHAPVCEEEEHVHEYNNNNNKHDPMEAVRMCQKGLAQGEQVIQECGLEPMVLAALGVVIGAAVHALVETFDGAALGADATQWRLKWADEAARIVQGTPFFADGIKDPPTNVITPASFLQQSPETPPALATKLVEPLPEGYHLQLRLHNDDVHTFDEVIDALHEPRIGRRPEPPAIDPLQQSLVPVKERATEMTHHVDADGQVTVKTYSTIPAAMQGFRRLKSRGLHAAVVSAAQVQMELRARHLVAWLQDMGAAHPAVAALVVHALVQVDPDHDLAGVYVWKQARMMPIWAGMECATEQDMIAKRFHAFPPQFVSSYVTREEAELLHGIAMSVQPEQFVQLTGASPTFYSNVGWRLPSDRYKKSPHALWGTLPSLYSDPSPPVSRHPMLQRLVTGIMDEDIAGMKNALTETVYVVDTDFRKQQEADRITTSVFPHKLPGLHMISGIGTVKVNEISDVRLPLPSPMEMRHLLACSSFRAPLSPILVLLLTDPYPTKAMRSAVHSLFLSLLTDSRFRCRFAGAIGIAYRPLTTLFCAGVGTEADTPLHFTVQIFTAGSLIRALGNAASTEKLLLSDKPGAEEIPGASIGVFVSPIAHTIVRCIHTNLLGATKEVNMILKNTANDDNSHDDSHLTRNEGLFPSLTYVAGEHPLVTPLPAAPDDGFLDSRSTRHKRLPHLLRDLEYVIETTGTAIRLLLSNHFPVYQGPSLSSREEVLTFPSVYARMLRLGQGMDPQKRKISGGHVEYEQNRWLEAFGLSLNLAGTRDALAESSISTTAAGLLAQSTDGEHLVFVREATGNIIASLLREIKMWLYREGLLETGLPVSPAHSTLEIAQAETLQRSTLHVSNSLYSSEADNNTPNAVALACATGVKMTETQLTLIENALRAEAVEREHLLQSTRGHGVPRISIPGPVMSDWLRVPHSPLGGDSLSFHLPLHRALAKCVKSSCGLVIPSSVRTAMPSSWWKIPVLDVDVPNDPSIAQHHPLVPLLGKTLRFQNCRVTWSSGPECTHQEAQRRKARSRAVSANIAVAKVLHSLADHPIRCIAAAQQIERHLWARNGSSVAGMAMNYSSTPLCRSFRDLDVLLIQLSASGMSCGLGARRVWALLLSRFNMEGFLCDPERRSQVGSSGNGVYAPGSGTWVPPPRLTDPDHAVVLSESLFSTLCVIVSELPPPPPSSLEDDNALKQVIRRELLHALAAEPRSHSEALAAASAGISRREESEGISGVSGGGSAFRDVFTDVLGEVAKQKTQSSNRAASGPPTYELKPDFCDEYDPTFFHLRRIEHQHAMDVVARLRKQKWGNDKESADPYCLPLVCPPPKAHPRFLPCRLLLHLPSMDAALRRALLFALTGGSWLPPSEPVSVDDMADDSTADATAGYGMSTSPASTSIHDIPVTSIARRLLQSPSSGSIQFARRNHGNDNVPFSKEVVAASSVSFLEVLQLLTLQVHTLEECASLHRLLADLDDESRTLSAGLSINSYLSRLIGVPDSMVDVWALKPYPDGPLTSKGSGEKRGSILGLLVALYEHRADHAALLDEDNNGEFSKSDADDHGGARSLSTSGLKWLLRFVNSLVDGASSVGAAAKSATTGVPIGSQPSSPSSRPSMTELGSSSWTIGDEVRSTVSGMLAGLPELWPKKDENATSPADKASSKSKEVRKAAQLRVMEKMKKQQEAFAATIAPSTNIADEDAAESEADLCIICRCDDTDGENNGPLGYLGHVQRSRVTQLRASTESSEHMGPRQKLFQSYRVVGHMGCQLRETESMDSKPLTCLLKGSVVSLLKSKVSDEYGVSSRRVLVRHVSKDPRSSTELITEGWASVRSSQGYVILSPLASICYMNSSWGGTRPIIKQCGHAAHLTCVETHTASLHQRSAAEQPYDGRFAANIKEGEFLCPLCKQLSNILLPRDNLAAVGDSAAMDVDEDESQTLLSVRPLRSLLTGTRMTKLSSKHFQGLGRDALSKFGIHLYNAMSLGADSRRGYQKKQLLAWRRPIRKWDYEEDDFDDDEEEEEEQHGKVGSILRLFRQQLIAWTAVGHSACTAEAASRGVEEKLPFGVMSQTNEPWAGFKEEEKDTHAMLLELMRTLTAASGLLEVLCLEMREILVQPDHSAEEVWIIGACLADILDGRSWLTADGASQSSPDVMKKQALWSEVIALTASMPCHVAQDGVLLQRCEARATAAAMWAIKGVGTSGRNKGEPPAPLAVNRLLESGLPPIPRDWGSMNPYVKADNLCVDSIPEPFRPGIAAAFLYKPLLVWDLNSLAGAVFSAVLANDRLYLPSSAELCQVTQVLLVGRMIQAISTPFGIDLTQETEDDDEPCWSETETLSEGAALGRVVSYCRTMVKNKSLQPIGEMNVDSDVQPHALLTIIGEAILPYARSLILMLRACSAVVRQRRAKVSDGKQTPGDLRLMSIICDPNLMICEDGFHLFKALDGPYPSALIDTSGPWKPLIDRWLISAVGFELHHGSMGKSNIPTSGIARPVPTSQAAFVPQNDMDMQQSSSQVDMVVDDEVGQDSSHAFDHQHVLMDEDLNESDEELNDGDEAEEIVDFGGQMIGGPVFQQNSNVGSSGSVESEDNSSSGSEGDAFDSDREFAHVSRSPILPYQPCTLAVEDIGPGRQGTLFEFEAASAVMADLSHLGLVHRRYVPTFSFIRLPKSFVELYNMVNKVKGRDDSHAEESEDMGSSETAICLLTGTVMRSGTSRRGYSGSQRPPGTCTVHARKHGSGIGLFFLVQKCTVLLMHNNKSAYSPSIYVDEHGEEDPGLRRGRPLFLNEARYKALEALWRQQGIPREVAQIRSTSDRVIRDNWY